MKRSTEYLDKLVDTTNTDYTSNLYILKIICMILLEILRTLRKED